MATIGEEAKVYEPQQVKTIAELDEISIDFQLQDGEGKDQDGKPFKYKYLELNGEKYKVPWIVLSDLKEILKVKPGLKKFKVTKTGTGLGTRYNTIQLD